MVVPRVRRRPEESRRLILEAAEHLLVEGGPSAVALRTVAARVGMTDAGVAHHFGSRSALLAALLRHGGRRIRTAIQTAVASWVDDGADVGALIQAIADVYDEGYAPLAVALHAAGWEDDGLGFLDPVVEALQAARERGGRPGQVADTRLAVAALHQALALDSVYGRGFRRSAGIDDRSFGRSEAQMAWWATTLQDRLGLPGGGRGVSA